jgi:hypothetical protein
MAGYDDPGENPFFVSYQEGTSINRTQFKDSPMAPSFGSIDSILRSNFPGITPYQRDWAWKELQNKGILEKLGDPNFETLVKDTVKGIFVKTAGAIEAFEKRRAEMPFLHRK